MHARAIGVEDPRDLDVEVVLAVMSKNSVSAQRLPSS
jgi:hypothetical protein